MKTATEVDGTIGVISQCSTKTTCETAKELCEKSDECEVGCCDSDECNASSSLFVSVILMAACSVFGLALLE